MRECSFDCEKIAGNGFFKYHKSASERRYPEMGDGALFFWKKGGHI
jgi:hypothetical protein